MGTSSQEIGFSLCSASVLECLSWRDPTDLTVDECIGGQEPDPRSNTL
jgi:hypothetical protein